MSRRAKPLIYEGCLQPHVAPLTPSFRPSEQTLLWSKDHETPSEIASHRRSLVSRNGSQPHCATVPQPPGVFDSNSFDLSALHESRAPQRQPAPERWAMQTPASSACTAHPRRRHNISVLSWRQGTLGLDGIDQAQPGCPTARAEHRSTH